LQFDGILTMTHHATNLDLPGEANITTAAGDVATFQSTGSNTVQCINYTRADGTPIVSSSHTPEGTAVLSTGEAGGTKFLREDGDNSCSWQTAPVTSVSGSTGAVADGDIDHDSLGNFAANEHFTQANITATGTIATGVWNGTAVDGAYVDLEGTELKSTGEAGGSKYLREDGDNSCSWQTVPTAPVTSVSGSTGVVVDGDIDHDSLANFASNEHFTQANITATGTIASGTWNGTSIGTTYTDAKVTSVSGSTGAVVDGDIDHDALANFAANEHYTQANITATGTIASGTWQGTAVDGTYVDLEGTEVKSTGESGGTKYLREDGDGTCSWQTVGGGLASGTKALFKQSSAPTGWTVDDTITDKSAVRYTRSGSYGADAGSVNLATGVSATQGHSLSTAELASHSHSHSHTIALRNTGSGVGHGNPIGANSSTGSCNTGTDATTAGSGSSHSHDINLRYTDVIVATKN
jgi:hypothetical protein